MAGIMASRASKAGHQDTFDPTDLATPSDPRPGIEQRLSRMIQVPTVSAEGAARNKDFEHFINDLLPELYPLLCSKLDLERVTDRGLLFHWKGKGASDPAVLMAHFDVVPAHQQDGWSFPPFEGTVVKDTGDTEHGMVLGRGALDDKGALSTLLEAVENLLADGFTPARDIYLSLGGNEETDGAAAEAISDLLHERGITPWIVVDEGGAVIDPPFPGVSKSAAVVGTAEKGELTVMMHTTGRGGHASKPGRQNAITEMARALHRLRRNPFHISLSAPTAGMLESFAQSTPFAVRMVLANLWFFGPILAHALVFAGPELASVPRTTLAATKITGGTAGNVLPSSATATLNLRLAPGETVDSTLTRLKRIVADPKVTFEPVDEHDPSPVSPTDTEQFTLITQAVAASYPDAMTTPYLMMQATDSRSFHRYAQCVYRFAPIYMSGDERATVHGIDERVRISSLQRGERFYQALIRSLPGA